MLGKLTREKFDPDAINVRLDPQLMQKLVDVQTANTVIYRNAPQEKLFEEPFIIGSGFAYKRWPSLQVDITKGKRTMGQATPPQRFRLAELYNLLNRKLQELRMSEMTITDKFYVDGQLIRNDQRFLTGPSARPCLHIKNSDIKLQVLPKGARPISTWPNQDAAFYDVAKGIERVISGLVRAQ